MEFHQEDDLIYHVECPEESCSDGYIGESDRRVTERVKDHNGTGKSSHMLWHSIEKNHTEVTVNDFKMIGRNYRNNIRKQKVMEALLIKQFHPTMNVQKQPVAFKLFN